MSESEIDKGTRSLHEISKALADIKIGIVCLTPENLSRPWLLFEAGALSKSIDERTRLCTYLVGDFEPSDVTPPLGMFQGTKSTKEDTYRLVQTINRVVSDEPISDDNLETIFEAMWPKLENRLNSLPPAESAVPAKRPPDEIMGEILELARAQASFREKTQFLDAYIPTFQQFLPVLHQLVDNVNRQTTSARPSLRYPTDTSLERGAGQSSIVNTFGFPRALANAIPVDLRMAGRRLDLVQMFGASNSTPNGAYSTIRFTVRGLNLSTRNEESYEIDFALGGETARKIAFYLERLADDTDRHSVRHQTENIKTNQETAEIIARAKKEPNPEG